MSVRKVSARLGKDEKSPQVTVDFELGETVEELVEQYGDEIVAGRATSAIIVDLQAFIRGQLRRFGVTDESTEVTAEVAEKVQAEVEKWKPGTRAAAKTPAEKALSAFEKLSDEEKAALLDRLTRAA